MTITELYRKYGMLLTGKDRLDLSPEEKRDFVNDRFDTYEEEGFLPAFHQVYDLYKKDQGHDGQPFEVLSRCAEGKDYDLEVLPMWNIRFPDGHEMAAYPEEICRNACKTNPVVTLTEGGRETVRQYIDGLKEKRKEILDAGKDTADETGIPTEEDIVSDILFQGLDEDSDYYDGWGCTDHYDADSVLGLTYGEDFEVNYE